MVAPSSLSPKGRLLKSFCSSYRFNPRNVENHWYAFWQLELAKITEEFNNIAIVPQYALSISPEEEEMNIEDVEEFDEDGASEDDLPNDDNNAQDESSDDELDLFRDDDESVHSFQEKSSETEIRGSEATDQDPDSSITDSLFTIPDGFAASLTPDFVGLHILATKLDIPTKRNPSSYDYDRRAGYRITHECCAFVMEIKRAPTRDNRKRSRELKSRLSDAVQDLGYQCYYLFKKYTHARRTIAIAASGDHWAYRIVTHADIPIGVEDQLDTAPWEDIKFSKPVVLGSPESDRQFKDILKYLREQKPCQRF